MNKIEKELEDFFTEPTIYLHKGWVEKGEEALAEIVKKDLSERKNPTDLLRWTPADAQWDPIVVWLQNSIELKNSNIPHYVLLWLATDKVHGFWRRKREKSLDNSKNWSSFSWSLRARIGMTASVMAQSFGPSPLHDQLILLFRNPLLFRLNPKGKLLPNHGIQYWEEQDGEWRRALDVLSYPLTMRDILTVRETLVAVDRRLSNAKEKNTESTRWVQITGGKNIEGMTMTLEKSELFSLLPQLVNAKELKKYNSHEALIAICSYLSDFWKKMTEFEVINHYFNAIIVHDEQGFGEDIIFY